MKISIKALLALALAALASASAIATPVTYSGWVVSDGKLGSWTFTRALVTFKLNADTRNTVTSSVSGATVYTNDTGSATVTIRQGGKVVTARLNSKQIFARLDLANGQVGFGSAISPYYPFSLGCLDNPAGCTPDSVGLAGRGFSIGLMNESLVDVIGAPADAPYFSTALNAEANDDLRGPMLLTGHGFTCNSYDSNSGTCATTLPPALTTDKGDLYFLGTDGTEKGVFRASINPDDD
jgi:hypothetical protein